MAETANLPAKATTGSVGNETADGLPTRRNNLRVKTLEIRWHDSKPISSCDFQPRPLKRTRSPHPASNTGTSGNSATPQQSVAPLESSYKLATGGEDNNVRIWIVHPNILPPSYNSDNGEGSEAIPAPRPPRIEYLSTLNRHTAAVNVIRWSPNGELIASAGDDGMIIIWTPSATPSVAFGADTSEDAQYDKEHWKPRLTLHCTTMQVYDLAWSPNGDYILAGSTDNIARIFSTIDGKCVRELAEHTHYVQGVAWDPMNEFIATQSSDRSVHVYSISTKQGSLEIHPVGKNARMTVRHVRTPSLGRASSITPNEKSNTSTSTSTHIPRPRNVRRDSATSDAESVMTSASEFREEVFKATHGAGPLTPAASVASTPSVAPSSANAMFPPPPIAPERERAPSSRRSSFSSSQAPGSPATTSFSNRIGRSPSPMPPLPAIATPSLANVRLYGDENFTNFFRRLTFSPDGGLLLTPAGQFEDPSLGTGFASKSTKDSKEGESSSASGGKPASKSNPGASTGFEVDPTSPSSVYIYSRMNFAKPPIGQIPGFKKASVAVRFSPVLYELRGMGTDSKGSSESQKPVEKDKEPVRISVEPGKEETTHVDLMGAAENSPAVKTAPPLLEVPSTVSSPIKSPASATASMASMIRGRSPTPQRVLQSGSSQSQSAHTPATPASSGSVFALPYRMLFAVATMDTITVHDTQQAGPICLFTKLHYDEFTDMTWSPDGQCLILSSRDGYCTIIIFDETIPLHPTQQQGLQLQSIAQSHGAAPPVHNVTSGTPSAVLPFGVPTPSPTPSLSKRQLSPGPGPGFGTEEGPASAAERNEPPIVNLPVKKKRRVEVTKISDLPP